MCIFVYNIIERANRDKYINKNGKKLIELCKMSDLKIVNGRIGKDKYGEYTCQTKQEHDFFWFIKKLKT